MTPDVPLRHDRRLAWVSLALVWPYFAAAGLLNGVSSLHAIWSARSGEDRDLSLDAFDQAAPVSAPDALLENAPVSFHLLLAGTLVQLLLLNVVLPGLVIGVVAASRRTRPVARSGAFVLLVAGGVVLSFGLPAVLPSEGAGLLQDGRLAGLVVAAAVGVVALLSAVPLLAPERPRTPPRPYGVTGVEGPPAR